MSGFIDEGTDSDESSANLDDGTWSGFHSIVIPVQHGAQSCSLEASEKKEGLTRMTISEGRSGWSKALSGQKLLDTLPSGFRAPSSGVIGYEAAAS